MKTFLFRLRGLLSFALAIFLVTQAQAASYSITNLGTLGGVYSEAYAVNASGQVTGYSYTTGNKARHAFLYSDGVMTDLDTFAGIESIGWDINDCGQVAGQTIVRGQPHAFLYSRGIMTDLDTLGGSLTLGGSWSRGHGINAKGQVTGYSLIPGDKTSHAFLYSNGIMTDLGTLGGWQSGGEKINDKGQVTGGSGTGGDPRAFLYSNGNMINLGTIGGAYSSSMGKAINASGQVTGMFTTAQGNDHAFLYSNGTMIDLGTLDGYVHSHGLGINASGQVVGNVQINATTRAFLYSDGTMTNLNDLLPANSGWTLWFAYDINDAGQIVGWGYHNGEHRAFLMSPAQMEPVAAAQCALSGGVTLSTQSLSLTEGGSVGTYTMVLTSSPTADVVVTVSVGTQLDASPTQLTFTPANWNTPQTITVQALQDGIAEGNHVGTINHTVASGDTRYNGLAVGNVTVLIADAVIPTVSVPVASGTFWAQSDLPVTGTAAPNATITLTVNNLSTGEVRGVSVVAGADGNWNMTLTALTDGSYKLQPEADGITGSKVSVAIDSHAPVSTLSIASDYGPTASVWYTGAVNLAVTATDGVGGSGVERSESTLDGGAWTVTPSDGLPVNTDGNHTVCYRSVDKAGNIEAARCIPVPIDATAPSVNPVFDNASNLLHLNVQDAISGIASIEISRDGGQTWAAQSGPAGFTRDGTYTVHYRVRDNAGTLATGQTTVTMVTIPLIAAPADQNAFEAASQNFNLGSFSDQAADNPWNVDVDWGDGSAHSLFTLTAPGALGALPHAYADNGTYTVTMKVTDQAGNTGSSSFKITVANVAPAATFTATSGPLNEGDVATLSFSNPIDPSPIDTQAGFRYAFDCGDGNGYGAASTTSSITCAALDNPNQTVKGKVIDKDGGATEYSAVIAINNMVPVLDAVTGPSSPVQRDTPATISVDFIDPGVRDTHTAMIDWDDGTVSAGTVAETNGSGSISASHSYAKPGRYIVTLTVTDKDGVSATATYSAIRVKGGPPVR